AARSDGENYGKLLLYQFPKQRLVYGPEQIEALLNQDPEISQQISLWNRQGSRAVQGNLLVIPIEQSLLYVEPIYLEAERNSLPTLARVVVAYENRIVMRETLAESLQAVFETEPVPSTPLVVPISEGS
ncbi:MAG: COG1615 family transporter, partial [Okeania sp. SIO2H7]|nr:COG1615 family transporter [Okeania sp. SIO2H7]